MQRIKTALLFSLLSLILPPASCAAALQAGDAQPLEPIYRSVQKLLKQEFSQNLKSPHIQIKRLSHTLRLPHCLQKLSYRLLQPSKRPGGRHTVMVTCPSPRWKIFISAEVRGQRPVLISTKLIGRHTLIRKGQVKTIMMDSRNIPKGSLQRPEEAIGQRARRTIAPNTIIKAQMLLPPYWVNQNKPVTIISRIGSVEVQTEGIALKNAVENETVAVKNSHSGKVIRAIVIAPNTVLVP